MIGKPTFHFQNLNVYNKAKTHFLQILYLSKTFEIPHYLKDQWLRAALSILLNIAEGSGRIGKKEKIRFYNIARSSVFECVAITDILISTERISYLHGEELLQASDELSRMLYTMTRKKISQNPEPSGIDQRDLRELNVGN